MQVEYEATFTRVDKESVRTILKDSGAKCVHPEFLMKRVVFHTPVKNENAWLRVRQEADKITMSFKQIDGTNIENQKEAELIINDFEAGEDFLTSLGAEKKAYQETLREQWSLDGVEVTIDTWPGLEPLVEVEGESEEVVRLISEKLGFDWNDAKFCEVSTIYEEELGIAPKDLKDNMPIITFENPPKAYDVA